MDKSSTKNKDGARGWQEGAVAPPKIFKTLPTILGDSWEEIFLPKAAPPKKIETPILAPSLTKNDPDPETWKLAQTFQARLPTENPNFLKHMLKSHVSGGFWLGLPSKFCNKYLPLSGDLEMKLVEQKSGTVLKSVYLSRDKGLSAGWRGFSLKHKLNVGDVLIFEFLVPDTFKVYVFRCKHNPNAANIIHPTEKKSDVAKTEKPMEVKPSVAYVGKPAEKKHDVANLKVKNKLNVVSVKKTMEKKPHVAVMDNPVKASLPVDVYAVQCANCFKMRLLEACEQFEEIRSDFTKIPFFCNKIPNVSCDDRCDLEHYANVIWVIDKPDIPKTPNNFTRKVEVKIDFSGCDAFYEMPNGEKIRSFSEMKQFLEAHPEYKKSVSLLDFTFTTPMITKGTVPGLNNEKMEFK